jgi:hypothetical protein
LRIGSGGRSADAFFGASPVAASALDIRAARPARTFRLRKEKIARAFGSYFYMTPTTFRSVTWLSDLTGGEFGRFGQRFRSCCNRL